MAVSSASAIQSTVSAIVSVYKAECFIRGCLEDLVSQTLFQQGRLEIVVVNSASPEHEEPIILAFQQRYPDQILCIRTPQRETVYQAWNRAIQVARGAYITNANCDDRHRSDALHVMAHALECNPDAAAVYANSYVTDQENQTFANASPIGSFEWPDYDRSSLFKCCYIGPQPMWRRSLHDRYGLFDGQLRSAGDYEFWLRLAVAGEKFLHINQYLGLYLQSTSGVELSNVGLSMHESEQARIRNWPSSWGQRPRPEGSYLVPCRTINSNSPQAIITPLVSVVVPTCNRPDFLARALQSILNQTYPSVEILVVNDGGIDVRELVEYHNQRGNIRYIHLPKKVERSAARNIALRAAQGEYIAYLDDDDRYYPEHLATLVECLQKTGAAVAYSDARRVHGHLENGQLVVDKHDVPFSIDYNSRRLLIENYIPILCIMHKRSLLDQAGMFDETLTRLEDWDLWIRLSQHAHFEHLAAITCEFTHHAAGSTLAAENAPAFLNSCRQIYQRYAYLVQGQPDLLKWQRKVLHHKTCYVYDYLREVLQALVVEVEDQKPMQRDELLHRLRLHGVTQAQLESALLWCMGLQSTTGAAEDYFLKALVNDEENVRAREELVQHYLRQKRYAEATQHLEALNRQNPEDEQVMGVLEKMRRC